MVIETVGLLAFNAAAAAYSGWRLSQDKDIATVSGLNKLGSAALGVGIAVMAFLGLFVGAGLEGIFMPALAASVAQVGLFGSRNAGAIKNFFQPQVS